MPGDTARFTLLLNESGDLLTVHIAAVDVPGRQLDLIPHRQPGTKKKRKSRKNK